MSGATPTPEQILAFRKLADEHVQADRLARGTYFATERSAYRACSVGCMAADVDRRGLLAKWLDPGSGFGPASLSVHQKVAAAFGLEEWIVHAQDTLFEFWSERTHTVLPRALSPRRNWEAVRHRINYRLLKEYLPEEYSESPVTKPIIHHHLTLGNNFPAARSAADRAAGLFLSQEMVGPHGFKFALDTITSTTGVGLLAIKPGVARNGFLRRARKSITEQLRAQADIAAKTALLSSTGRGEAIVRAVSRGFNVIRQSETIGNAFSAAMLFGAAAEIKSDRFPLDESGAFGYDQYLALASNLEARSGALWEGISDIVLGELMSNPEALASAKKVDGT